MDSKSKIKEILISQMTAGTGGGVQFLLTSAGMRENPTFESYQFRGALIRKTPKWYT